MLPLNPRIPNGILSEKWRAYQSQLKSVTSDTHRKYKIIVVGAGLAGTSTAISLARSGYFVKFFCMEDSPRRASSLAAHGKGPARQSTLGKAGEMMSFFRELMATGDFRSREANAYRLAELRSPVYEYCNRLGVAFDGEGPDGRGKDPAMPLHGHETVGQQILVRLYWSLMAEAVEGHIEIHPWTEMMDLVLIDEEAHGIIVRHLPTGRLESHYADAVVLATGGYSNIYGFSTNACLNNATAIWRAYKKGAFFANPSFVQYHPFCLAPRGDFQTKRFALDEALRQDARVWTPKQTGEGRYASKIPEKARDYFLERKYPDTGDLCPGEYAVMALQEIYTAVKDNPTVKPVVYLDFSDGLKRLGADGFRRKYGDVLSIYEKLLPGDPYSEPLAIAPAPHYTLGGLWVNYQLMTTISGLFVVGEANFADHGANRSGNQAMLQALADGLFILPVTLSDYLAHRLPIMTDVTHLPVFQQAETAIEQVIQRLVANNGNRPVADFHQQLGSILWNYCGPLRSKSGLETAQEKIVELKQSFWQNVSVAGSEYSLNVSLETALRVADYFELAELMIQDALQRKESCGVHLRQESMTPLGHKIRDDRNFSHVATWQYMGNDRDPVMYKEQLAFEAVRPEIR